MKFGTNPGPDKLAEMEDDGVRFRCNHRLTTHPRGAIVSKKDLGPYCDVDRLVSIGAVLMIHGGQKAVEEAAKAGVEPVVVPVAEPPPIPKLPESIEPENPIHGSKKKG